MRKVTETRKKMSHFEKYKPSPSAEAQGSCGQSVSSVCVRACVCVCVLVGGGEQGTHYC